MFSVNVNSPAWHYPSVTYQQLGFNLNNFAPSPIQLYCQAISRQQLSKQWNFSCIVQRSNLNLIKPSLHKLHKGAKVSNFPIFTELS